jgi:DNA-binding GntR family transcriptional regulator
MLDAADTASGQGLYAVDVEFHEMLAAFTQNTFFLQAVQQQNRMRRLLEVQGNADRRRVRDWVREHLAIIDALRAGRNEVAAERLVAHLDRAYRATRRRSGSRRGDVGTRPAARAAE